jgi:hypothetical protein
MKDASICHRVTHTVYTGIRYTVPGSWFSFGTKILTSMAVDSLLVEYFKLTATSTTSRSRLVRMNGQQSRDSLLLAFTELKLELSVI